MNEPASPDGGRRWLFVLARWLVPVLLLAVLLWRIPLAELRQHFGAGPVAWIALYVLVQVGVTLLADGWATQVALIAAGIRRSFGAVLLVRGASYLLSVLNFLLGQGGIGIYLVKTGVSAARSTGVALLVSVVALSNLLVVGFLALVAYRGTLFVPGLLPAVGFAMAAWLAYLVVVAKPPAWLRRRDWLGPLTGIGLGPHLKAFAGRLPHTFLLLLGHWGGLRLWGVEVPLGEGMALIAIVLLITALPIAPAGLGTFQAAQVWLLSPYVVDGSGEAGILAFSLTYHACGMLTQVLYGALCLGPAMRVTARYAALVQDGDPGP
ncbi:MAG: lysylphosphatidylglycerol synthase domain-containing protein [Acidobacteriota bacterium]